MSDLFAPHQVRAIERVVDERCAAMLSRVLEGANERLAAAIDASAHGEVMLPVFHLKDIARIEGRHHAR